MRDTTRAIIVEHHGGPEVLVWKTAEIRQPGPDEILVRITAAGVNFIDTYHRDGLYPVTLPFTPGVEGAGVVEAVGRDVATPAVGDRVVWTGALGSYAQFNVMPAEKVTVVPDGVALDTAAAVALQGMTAHYLTTDTYPLSAGDTCLVHAGAGGVGHLLIQLAKMRGATVLATAGGPEKAEVAAAMGADHVIDYRERDFKEAIEDLVGPRALSVVYDGVGRDTFDRSLALLRPRGTMVTYGNASGPPEPLSPLRLMQEGSLFLTRPSLYDYVSSRADVERRANDLFGWLKSGVLEVKIGLRLPLEAAADAHRALQARETIGKVILEA